MQVNNVTHEACLVKDKMNCCKSELLRVNDLL